MIKIDTKQLDYLKYATTNLAHADDELIRLAIIEMRDKPITVAKINKGWPVERVAIHDKDFRATNLQRLSYIKDPDLLARLKRENTYGRANLPGQSIFYGAMPTIEVPQARATAFMETSKMPYNLNINEEYFTVSRWIVKEEFEVIELVFADTEGSSEMTQEARQKQEAFLDRLNVTGDLRVDAFNKLKFFSGEYAKVVAPGINTDYKITAHFTDIYLNHSESGGICGVAYPSVKSKHLGQNVAFLPEAVDRYLEFDRAVVMKAERQADGVGILMEKSFEIAIGCDVDGNLTWEEII